MARCARGHRFLLRRGRPPFRVAGTGWLVRSAARLALSTHPQFTSQVLDGRFRRPIDFAVRTPSSTTPCWRCSTSMNWAWWLPGHAGYPAGRGDVRADDGVPPAGGALGGGQVSGLTARRPRAAPDPSQPGGPAPGPAEQVGDLGNVLVFLRESVLVHGDLPRGGWQQASASSSVRRTVVSLGAAPKTGS
jgi:hypothetical protein